MLFSKYTTEWISNFIAFYLKNRLYILLKQKKENSSDFFLFTVNQHQLYLKMWSLFQSPLQKVILYPRKPWSLFLRLTSNAVTRIYIWNLILFYMPWIVIFLTNTKINNNHKLLQPSSPLWLVNPIWWL